MVVATTTDPLLFSSHATNQFLLYCRPREGEREGWLGRRRVVVVVKRVGRWGWAAAGGKGEEVCGGVKLGDKEPNVSPEIAD